MYTIGQFINGAHLRPECDTAHPIINPALDQQIGSVLFAEKKTVEQAIESAKAAFQPWAQTPPLKRARILFNYKSLLEEHMDEIARLVTLEHGKTLEDAKGSVLRAIEVVEHHCGIAAHLRGDYSANVGSNIDTYTFRQPLGVCAGVSPFNFPVMVPVWMMVPAIACGNTFVLKPSEQTPAATMRIVELLHQAGLPKGVVNVVNGDKAAVDALLASDTIQAITAVASTPVAETIYQQAVNSGKRSHTFGGAKNHCIVMPDADIAQSAKAIAGAAFGAAGERCMALSVAVTVGEQTADALIDALKKEMAAIKVGDGLEPNSDMGPLVSRAHLQKVKNYIGIGVEEGATLVVDGRELYPEEAGYYLGPTLFDHVTESMCIYQEEIFGPVLAVVRAEDFASAVALINRHQFGNGTAIFTNDGYVARTFTQQIQVGMVGVNVPIPVPVAYHPFGGWKRSVFGDTNMHGDESVKFYTKQKTVTSRWLKEDAGMNAFVMPTMGHEK